MTENQKKIIRKLQWIFYPVALLLMIDFILKFMNHSPLAPDTKGDQLVEVIDQIIMIVVFLLVAVGVLALMQQFFTRELIKPKNTGDAAYAKLLMKIEVPNQKVGSLILFIVALGFSVMFNCILFATEFIFEQEQIDRFEFFEKIIFGFFYSITHFLVLVFGLRLFKGIPPVFMQLRRDFVTNRPASAPDGFCGKMCRK